MAGPDVDVPKLGKVNKKWVWAAVAVAGGYVAWKWYSANNEGVSITTPAVGEDLPTGGAGMGPVSGNVQYAGTVTDATDPDRINTNAQWSQRAAELLGNAGYDTTRVYAALGDYLANAPLTTEEQSIVRAALAAVGRPPIGGPYTIREQVGKVTLKAPSGVHVTTTTPTKVTLAWSPVAGASYYRAYRSDTAFNVGATDARNHSITVGGLKPNTTYRFAIAADTTTGKPGPKSAWVTAKTKPVPTKSKKKK